MSFNDIANTVLEYAKKQQAEEEHRDVIAEMKNKSGSSRAPVQSQVALKGYLESLPQETVCKLLWVMYAGREYRHHVEEPDSFDLQKYLNENMTDSKEDGIRILLEKSADAVTNYLADGLKLAEAQKVVL